MKLRRDMLIKQQPRGSLQCRRLQDVHMDTLCLVTHQCLGAYLIIFLDTRGLVTLAQSIIDISEESPKGTPELH